MKKGISLFIMPRSSSSWKGAEALWITVAGWASASEKVFGKAFVLTTDRIATPKEILNYPLENSVSGNKKDKSYIGKFLPNILKTFIKDLILWKISKNKTHYNYEIPKEDGDGISLIWEQHDFFPGIGYELSKKYKVPYIIYVHAPQVWESAKWGIKRPIWGRILEKMETKSLLKADVVACVSKQVKEQLIQMGIPSDKILVSPMAVDPDLFSSIKDKKIIQKYNLENKLIIGWTGSFRSFHGLDLLLEVFEIVHKANSNTHLMLVGDGSEKENLVRLASKLNISDAITFTGKKKFSEIPNYVSSFALAIVSAKKASDFHYSPLKLREYLAAGITTLAPNAGEIPEVFVNNKHLKLYNVGEIENTAQIILDLINDINKRNSLAIQGKEYILKNGTWEIELNKSLDMLRGK